VDFVQMAPGVRVSSQLTRDLLNSIDTVIFDVDGVLLNVIGSFREVVSNTVQFYFTNILGYKGSEILIHPRENELFKLAGKFNNDWDLTYAAVLFYLWKSVKLNTQNIDIMRLNGLSLEEFTINVKHMGGGLEQAEKFLLLRLGNDEKAQVLSKYDKEKIWYIFQEFYCGKDLAPVMYGIEARYAMVEHGLVENEIRIIKPELLDKLMECAKNIGCLTGRVWNEAKVVLELKGILKYFKREYTITEDMGIAKPDPEGLVRLTHEFDIKRGIYIGDTLDDLNTVKNFRGLGMDAEFVFCAVSTGAHQEDTWDIFKNAGADIIASDVNAVLEILLCSEV
jgi:HAD superfamily phosphatase